MRENPAEFRSRMSDLISRRLFPFRDYVSCAEDARPAGYAPAFHRTSAQGEVFGLLVQVGFGIAAFTPPAYRRGSLPRPSVEVSSRRRLRA